MDFSFTKWVERLRNPVRRPIRRHRHGPVPYLGVTTLEDRTLPAGLGTYALIEGPSAGADADLVVTPGAWAASSNASWLHTTASGTGNGLAQFTFDANDGETRTGTVTIAGETLTVTQAGGGYTAASQSGLPGINANLYGSRQAAVDSAGNVYVADIGHNRIAVYHPADGTTTTLPATGLTNPSGVAVDAAGHVFIDDEYTHTVSEYDPDTGVTTALTSGYTAGPVSGAFNTPQGIAVDAAGKVYIADTNSNRLAVYNPADGTTTQLLDGSVLYTPNSVAFDAAGFLYMSDNGNNRILKYNPADGSYSVLVSSGFNRSGGLGVDGRGNVYFSDYGGNTVDVYNPQTGAVSTVMTGLNHPAGVAVTPTGDVAVANASDVNLKILPQAYVLAGSLSLSSDSGAFSIPIAAADPIGLTGALAPVSSQPWLTVTGVSPLSVDVSFAANTGTVSRSATVTLLGQTVSLTQEANALPAVDSPTATGLSSTAATLGGRLVSSGSTAVTRRGILYAPTATNASPTLGGSGVTEVDDSATTTGTFTESATGLSPGTGYSYVAFATNGGGTAYTPVTTFTTNPTVQFATASQSVVENAGTFSITVTLSSATSAAVTVPFSLGGTAVSGTDYGNVTSSPLVIPAGQTTGTITGTLVDHGYTLTNKTLTVTLGGTPTNADRGGTTTDTLTILSDPPPTVQFATSSQSASASGGTFSVTVNLSAASSVDTTVPFTLSGTAVAGTDYSNVSSSPLVIPAGQTTGTITGTVIANPSATTNPTLKFTLGSPTNATLGSTTADTLTIQESSLTPTVVDVGGLEFRTANGFAFSGGVYTTSDPVQVGFVPAQGQPFVALLTLQGNTTVDSSAQTVTNRGGAVQAVVSGSPVTLLAGGLNGASIAALTGAGLTGLSGSPFTAAHVPFTLTALALAGSGANGPTVKLQGTLALPYGLTVGVTGSNAVTIDRTGITLTGITATIPSQSFSLGGVQFSGLSLTATYSRTNDQFILTGGGTVTFGSPTGAVTAGLTFGQGTTPGLAFTAGALTTLDAAVTTSFTVGGVAFTARSLDFSYSTTNARFALAGTATAAVSGLSALSVTFGHGTTPGLVLTSGALTSLDTTIGSTFTAAGVTFTTQDLEFSYAAATGKFALAGTATAAVAGLGTLGVTFGHGSTPGLVVANGALASLDTTLTTNVTVSAVSFTTTGLEFSYAAATGKFALAGTATAAVAGLGTLGVTFGHGSTPGLVVTNGALVSLDMTLNSNLTVSGVTFTTSGLEFTYTASNSQYTLAGIASASVAKLGSISVTFGHGSTSGLVITNGSLVSLDMTLNTNLNVGGVTLTTTGLEFTYTASNSQYTLAGTATATVAKLGTISVTFGHGSTPGLVITNGSLVSLDMTLNTNLTLSAVTFTTTGLEFTYTAANSQYTLAGTATATVAKLGTISVTFGHGSTPGLVITNGSLVSLDMTLNSDLTLGSVKITTTGLEFTYTASNSQYTLAGTATATVAKLGTISVTFGHGSTPGLVITNGSLVSLDMTLNSNIRVGSLTFTTTGLEFTYTAANSQYTLAGTATVNVVKLGTISVTFGHGSTPGLVITNGSLVSLDMTLNTNIRVNTVTFTTTGLEFTYTAATDQYTLAGTAGVTIVGIGNLSVTFGHGSTPGLVITNGSLVSLDLTVNSNIRVEALVFSTTGLEFTYTAATDNFTLSGTAGVTILGVGAVSVTFGHGSTPGLVITNGSLVSLDMTLNSDIRVGSALFSTTGLEFTYTTATSRFTLAGTAGVTVAGIGNLSVTFGHGSSPGLVITNGSLVSLDLTVNSSIRVGAVIFSTTGLEFTYTASNSTFTLLGSAGVSLAGVAGLTVTFGHGSTPGLVITNGSLVSLDMTVSANFAVGAVTFTGSGLEFKYTAANSQFTLSGSAGVSVAKIGNITVTFGHGSTPGLVVTNGSLVSLDMTVNSNITVAKFTFNVKDLEFAYTASTSTFTIRGSASLSLGFQTFAVQLGNGTGSQGIVITNGSLASLDATVSDTFGVAGFSIGSVSLHVMYTAATQTYDFDGTADLTLTASLPGFFSKFISLKSVSLHIGSVSLHVHVVGGDNADSYSSLSTTLAGYTVGIKVTFDGSVSVTGVSDAIVQGIENAAKAAAAAAAAAAKAVADAAAAAANKAKSIVHSAGSALKHFFDNDLAGATVFYDVNGNGVLDPGELSTVTAADGTFTLDVPADGPGQLVGFGGTNVATGLPNTAVMSGPLDATELSPLSTLIQATRAAFPGLSEDEATATVAQALGIPATVDLRHDNVIAQALTGNADAARAFNAAVEVAGLVGGVNALVGGSTDAASAAAFANLATQLVGASGPLDLTDATVVQQLIEGTAGTTGATLDPALVSGAATVLAGINRHIESMPATGGAAYMARVVQSQTAAGTTAVPALVQAAAGQLDINAVVAAQTGDAFAAEAAAVHVGALAAPVSNTSPTYAVAAGAGGAPRVQVYDRQTGAMTANFFAFEPTFRGGSAVAVGDVNGDGVPDVVVAAGAGGAARVVVIDGTKLDQVTATGEISPAAVLANFFAFDPTFTGGATVALARLGVGAGLDIVVGAGAGGGPRVRTFALTPGADGGVTQLASPVGDFFAFDPATRFGVNVAAGDLDGVGRDDIIVGAGVGGGPVVAVFLPDGTLRNEFMAYDPALRGGVSVAAGYLDGTGTAQLVTGAGPGGPPVVNVYTGADDAPERSVQVFDPSFSGGVTVNSGPAGEAAKIVVGAGPGGGSRVGLLTPDGLQDANDFFGFESSFHGGVSVG